MISLGASSCNTEQKRNVDKYKLKANQLFQKLQNLQEQSQGSKLKRQKSLIDECSKKQRKVFQSQKIKQGWYGRILEMVRDIQNQLNDQQNQGLRCRRSLQSCVQSTIRELHFNCQRLDKERKKSQANLESFIQGKLQSFILKNKNTWNESSLIDKDPYLQELEFIKKEHKKFINEFEKQCDKLKKDTTSSLKDCLRLVEEELSSVEEDQIMGLMKTIHMDITNKLKNLKQQRERTQQRVISVLEKIISNIYDHSSKR